MDEHKYEVGRWVVFESSWGSVSCAKVMRHDEEDGGELMYALIDSDDYVHHTCESDIFRLDKEMNDYHDKLMGWLS